MIQSARSLCPRVARFGAVLAISLPGAVYGQSLPDFQLPLMPRTAKEAARIGAVTAPTTDFTRPERFEEKPAGAATVRARPNADAFSDPSANIGLEGRMTFNLGNGLFTKTWVSAPSSTTASDGLGPIFNARACQACHLKDGRGHPPQARTKLRSQSFCGCLCLQIMPPKCKKSLTG